MTFRILRDDLDRVIGAFTMNRPICRERGWMKTWIELEFCMEPASLEYPLTSFLVFHHRFVGRRTLHKRVP